MTTVSSLDLFRLKDRHAIIAGGAGLLGPAFAEALLEADADVTVLDWNAGALEKMKADFHDRFKERFRVAVCDVTNVSSVEAAVKAAETVRPIDILVNAVA